MFDIGWTEMALVAVAIVVVVGPKELPVVLRTIGRALSRARAMAKEFRDSIDEMADEADLGKAVFDDPELEKFRLGAEKEALSIQPRTVAPEDIGGGEGTPKPDTSKPGNG
ncbi:MAG: twin-arginine translocase subunit TatB [Alphaproteobacteria bacterium]|nr:twin-arginine translocase subunit TatB [Alphaproteobacteria bacterium]